MIRTVTAIAPRALAPAIALALVTLGLAACGGGGNVRSASLVPAPAAQPPPPPAPPPPAPPPAPPPPPPTAPASLTILTPAGVDRIEREGLPSAGTLFKEGAGALYLLGVSTFGDTQINEGLFALYGTLNSEVHVNAGAEFEMDGFVTGSVFNRGRMNVYMPSDYGPYGHPRITGNYLQASNATLWVQLNSDFRISGNATLEGGTLEIELPYAWNGPTTFSLTPQILHADGSITGTFDRVVLPSIFLSGTVNYGEHDITMSLARVSAASVLSAAKAGDDTTMASAHNLDAAFAQAGSMASTPSSELSAAQQQFLASTTAIWSIRDASQATATLDSLSGQGYTDARTASLAEASLQPRQFASRLGQLRDGSNTGAWVDSSPAVDMTEPGASQANAMRQRLWAGMDRAFSSNLVIGLAASSGMGDLRFDRNFGQASIQSPSAMAYVHYWRAAWYGTGQLSHTRSKLAMLRSIDLGPGGLHAVASEFSLDRLATHLELGRQFVLGRSQLNPFVGLGHESLRSGAFEELGDTGFELIGRAAASTRTSASLGLRYQRDWSWGDDGWARLETSGSYQRALHLGDGQVRASFTGAPQLEIDVSGFAMEKNVGVLGTQFEFGEGRSWSGFARHELSTNGKRSSRNWWLGAQWKF